MTRAPLALLLLLAAGCPVGPTQSDDQNAPLVTAVYATDLLQGPALGDVALFLAGDARVSATAPASYSALRIEFSQTLSGPTVASLPSFNGGTACAASPNAIFTDLDAGVSIPASACYDPSTPLGGGPGLTLIPGASADPSAVFTCQAFKSAAAFAPNHTYSITLGAAIKGANGKPLATPVGAGWSGATFTFRTGGFEPLAAGYQDPVTGFYHLLDKPSIGYLKDQGTEPASNFRQALAAPFVILFSDFIDPASISVSVVRTKDGTPFPASASVGDPRVVQVSPPVTWEPRVGYTVTLDPSLASARGGALGGSARTWEFTAAPAKLAVLLTAPVDGASAQPATTGYTLVLQTPVDPASVTSATVALTSGGTAVPARVFVVPGTNDQVIALRPSSRLAPATTYTVTTSKLQSAAVPVEEAGHELAGKTTTFRTATFGFSKITASGDDTGPNIDRAHVPATVVADGSLAAVFNDLPAGVTDKSLNLLEVSSSGVLIDTNATVARVGSTNAFTLTTPPGYALKLGQAYRVRAETTITDPNGVTLSAEVCSGDDCRDSRAFTTVALAVSIDAASPPDARSGAFKVDFNYPVETSTLDPLLPRGETGKAVRLSKTDALGNQTEVPVTCSHASGASTSQLACAPAGPLDPNTRYAIAVAFAPAAPLHAASPLVETDPLSGVVTQSFPLDSGSATFTGHVTQTFLTACP